jgi:rhodanese-related sulfurtransferase
VPSFGINMPRQAVTLSAILNAIPKWAALDDDTQLVLFCRSGNRSAQAARAIRRLGIQRVWSVWSLAGSVVMSRDAVESLEPAIA